MCGRYSQTRGAKELAERFAARAPAPALSPRYNIAPSQEAPVVLDEGAGRILALLRWGLIPSWAKRASIGRQPINARAETIFEKPSFKDSVRRRRCLVLADGFYEWRRGARGRGTPVRFVLEGPFAMAGLWDTWRDPAGETVRSFAIVTVPASPAVAKVHNRMPALLDRAGEDAWLAPDADPRELRPLLTPREAGLSSYEVSPRVNSPACDDARCAEPALVLPL